MIEAVLISKIEGEYFDEMVDVVKLIDFELFTFLGVFVLAD